MDILKDPIRFHLVKDTINFFPNQYAVKSFVFSGKGEKLTDPDVENAALQANFVNAMALLATHNGLSANDISHLIPPMLRMIKTKGDWVK